MKLTLAYLLGVATAVVVACTSLNKFDPSTATFKNEKEMTPIWKVDDREEEIMESLDKHGKLKVIRVKKENPVVEWVFGAGLAIGGVCILLGIAYIWMTKGVKLLEGALISGFGVTDFALFYLLDAYLTWVLVGVGVVFVGSLVYIFAFKKDMVEKLIMSFEEQKEHRFDEVEKHIKSTQGNKQQIISKLRKKVLKIK